MKLIVLLATIFLLSVRSIKIEQLEYGFCGELQVKQYFHNISTDSARECYEEEPPAYPAVQYF